MSLIASTLAAAAGERTPTWRVGATSGWSYDNVTNPIGGVITNAIRFKPDGTHLYFLSSTNDTVYDYILPDRWDISTAYATGDSVSVAAQTTPHGLHFKPDGASFYVFGSYTDVIRQYNMSVPWDITTATLYGNGLDTSANESTGTGLFIKPDGTQVFFTGTGSDSVRRYTLTTPWDITTMTATGNKILSVSGQEASPGDIAFNPDGDKLYLVGRSGDDVNYYELSTAWDVSTATFVSNFSVSSETTSPYSLTFKPDGSKMFIAGNDLWQYSTY